jgi:hypothetical protein
MLEMFFSEVGEFVACAFAECGEGVCRHDSKQVWGNSEAYFTTESSLVARNAKGVSWRARP